MRFSIFHPMVHFGDATLNIETLYEDCLHVIVRAEELGYHGFFFNEGHHKHPNFRLPNPRLLIAAAAQRTSKIQLGTALILLPYHDPRMVIEDAGILDALTHGRLILGIGAGFNKNEALQFGLNPMLRRQMDEVKRQIFEAIITGERFNINMPMYKAKDAELSIPLRSDLRSRVYRGTINPVGAYHIGKSAMGLMFSGNEALVADGSAFYRECLEQYHKGWSESPRAAQTPPEHYLQIYCHVAPTDEEAERVMGPCIEKFKREIADSKLPLDGSKNFYDYYYNQALALFGSAETVRRKVAHLQTLGAENIMTFHNLADIPHDMLLRSMELFAKEVIPAFTTLHTAQERQAAHA